MSERFTSLEEQRRQRLKLVNALGFCLNLVIAVMQVLVLGLENVLTGMAVGIVLTACTALGYLSADRNWHVETSARLLLTVSAVAIITEVAMSGGVTGYFGHALFVLPVLCALVLGSKDTTVVTGVTVSAIVVLTILDSTFGALPAFEISPPEFAIASAGTFVSILAGAAIAIIMLVRSAENSEAQLRILLAEQEHLASHDSLTGLANRAAAATHLDTLDPETDSVVAYLIDLDGFKQINDLFGHKDGDHALKTVADRLASITQHCRLVARLGGDEFLIVSDTDAENDPTDDTFAQLILAALRAPIQHDGAVSRLSGSVGSALFPSDAKDRSDLLCKADIALYASKHDGKGRYSKFKAGMGWNTLRQQSAKAA